MDSLLLIPDISGFTDFVHATEVAHSQHIVAELLELLIDADSLGMTVAEIEGDAILFYKHESVPSLAALLDQARSMFIRFHAHLKAYETRRICQCGACTTAHTLTLKIVMHRGPVTFLTVKNFHKPYGSNLILVHRLLKNDVPTREYALLTEPLIQGDEPEALPDWVTLEPGVSTYADLGPVSYRYAPLEGLHREIPEPEPAEPFALTPNPIVLSATLRRPLDDVYEFISNLAYRTRFNTDVDDFLFEPDRVNRVGTKHQCIVNGQVLDFETISASFGEDVVVYGERPEDPGLVRDFALFWLLQADGRRTHLRIEAHVHPHSGIRRVLALPFRLVMRRNMKRVLANVQRLTEQDSFTLTQPT